MELGGEDRGKREENKQPQPQPPPPHPQQHQKCPRCDSLNTKFCYYNNYSLSQPRYYCKSCKRYWTQGGTLRNIPVGGSRKGKRGNESSSSSSSSSHKSYNRSSQPHHQPSRQDHEVVQNKSNLVGPSPPTVVPPIGGYLSSMAVVHSLNSSSQSLNFGFNDVVSLGSQQHQHSQILLPSSRSFYHMDKGGAGEVGSSLYPASQQGLIIPSSMGTSMGTSGSSSQSFMNDANHRVATDAALWSTISTTTSINDNNSESNIRGSGSSSTLIPNNHWSHLPGYDPPPE